MAFWDNIRFPYFNFQELNLDWIMSELKRIAGFMPQDGNVGDILTRKTDGASWEPPEAVNININALPEDTEIGDNDQLIFYDISAQANRKIKPPNLLDSMMSNGTPLMDGTASPGTSKKPARYDHKHPTDTSRQAALTGTQMNAVNSGAPANAFSSGILKVANGGTGYDNLDDVKTALGVMDAIAEATISLGDVNTPKTVASSLSYGGCLLVIDGISAARQGLYIVGLRRTSACVVTPVTAASDVTVTAGTGQITISSSEQYTYAYLIPLGPSVAGSLTIT